jgi:hypothetical protein
MLSTDDESLRVYASYKNKAFAVTVDISELKERDGSEALTTDICLNCQREILSSLTPLGG